MPDTSDYIEEYLNHQLTIEERARFDEKLAVDKDFAGEVDEHARLFNSLDEIKAQELMLRFSNIEQELEGGKEKKIMFHVYLKWAATVTILAVLALVVYLFTTNAKKDLFLAYYTTYPNVENPVSRSQGEQDVVWLAYENGDYLNAYEHFKVKVAANNSDFASWFYLGICALEIDLLPEAENAFTKISSEKGNKYQEQGQWYLALSYLKAGNAEAAVEGLEEIAVAGSGYSEKAKALLGELE